jgi:hypothetical protein
MRGFIEELLHRNVFRVGVAYVVAGWLIVQVADVAADAFNAPDWFMQVLIIVLLVGLPVSLFLSWAYELTPDGLMKAHEVPADALKDPRSGRILSGYMSYRSFEARDFPLLWKKLTAQGIDRPEARLMPYRCER